MLDSFFGIDRKSTDDIFTDEFLETFAQEIVCHLYCDKGDISGSDWEKIFASCIGVPWESGNKFYDVSDFKNNIGWSAKTVKDEGGFVAALISGRNSPLENFNRTVYPKKDDPYEIGKIILQIWNDRVAKLKSKFYNAKTVVLLRSQDLLNYRIFNFDTEYYNAELYEWVWTDKNNLRAIGKNNEVKFLWQPKGSQFTIFKDIPITAIKVSIRNPPVINKKDILNLLTFNKDHYRVYYG